jgi:hypothetical protein
LPTTGAPLPLAVTINRFAGRLRAAWTHLRASRPSAITRAAGSRTPFNQAAPHFHPSLCSNMRSAVSSCWRIGLARIRPSSRTRTISTKTALSSRARRQRVRPTFKHVADFAPHDVQRRVVDLPLDPGGSVSLVEAETGSGKTEAALARYLRLFHAGLVDGMYFALPTRTAATQIHRRVLQAVTRAFVDGEARPPVVLAVPGYLAVDDHTACRLPDFEVLWNDDPQERYRFRGWAAEHPKRYLVGPVVVGTIDQVLFSTLMVSHAHLRATALLRHLLVVDEVHASDAYMAAILEQVLRYHVRAGGHALLMSATLGASARYHLLSAACGMQAGQLEPFTTAQLAPASPTAGGSPACAGIDLAYAVLARTGCGLPRVRGDRPDSGT